MEVIAGHPLLVKYALKALSKWRFEPAYLDGKPVEVVTTVVLEYGVP